MKRIFDLHVHSKYSRACSPNLNLPNMAAWARAKGIDVLATGDFTHPAWLKEIETKLVESESGLYQMKPKYAAEHGGPTYEAAPIPAAGRDTRFILSTEIACIYRRGGKTRRLHLVLLASSVAAARRLTDELNRRNFNLKSDGRPILGMDARDLLTLFLEIDPDGLMIPAHVWTPWFAVFGSLSGFDSLEECFGELTPHIHAIETGLSSDPPMNWRLKALDSVMLVSNSDAHGLRNIGREANVMDLAELSFNSLANVFRKRDQKKFLYTIEFFPEEGKYHVDGHRDCNFSCEPEKTKALHGLCPKCGKALVRGVLGRVDALADRLDGERSKSAVDYRSIVPLEEIVAAALGKTKSAKVVGKVWRDIIERVGPELPTLLDASIPEISEVNVDVAAAIKRMRSGDISVMPGYDGVFGKINLLKGKN